VLYNRSGGGGGGGGCASDVYGSPFLHAVALLVTCNSLPL
jgi:hypothetical protein